MPEKPTFAWDDRANRYRDALSGRFVSGRAVQEWTNLVINAGEDRVARLTGALYNGNINIREWQSAMVQEIRTLHKAAAKAAVGGDAQMNAHYWGEVGSELKKQYRALENFANQIIQHVADGTPYTQKQLLARARMYERAAHDMFEKLKREMFIAHGWQLERRILGQAEHCDECVEEAGKGWQPIGTLLEIGDTQCMTNCMCHFEYQRERVSNAQPG